MSVFSPSIRIGIVVLSVAALIAVYLSFGERENRAQPRTTVDPTPTAKFEQFSISDDVTSDIRDRRNEIVRVQFRTINDHDKAAKYGRVIEDFGSFAVLSKNKSKDMSRSGLDVQKIETAINLPGKKFDPIESPTAETVRAGENVEGERDYYIVQLGGISKDEWLDSIRDTGVEVLQYIPHNAFFVYGDGSAIAKVAGHSRVRWVGHYTPDQKRSPELARFANNLKSNEAMFDVAVFARADLDNSVVRISSLIHGRILNQIRLPNNFFNVVRIEASPDDIDEISKISDVFRIDPYGKPQIEDERSSQIISGNFSSTTVLNAPGYDPLTQFGVNGQNVTISMVDDGVSIPGTGGFYLTAANTVNGPLRGAVAGASGGHGHLNASIISGDAPFSSLDPTGYNYGLGVAPKSNIINIPLLTGGYSGSEADSYNDTVITTGPNGVLGSISNNSWGNGLNSNAYDSYAAQFDAIVRDASAGPTIDPICLIFSAGNSGPGTLTLTRPKAAKNLIAVGNSENIRTEIGSTGADNLDDLRGSSSRGPTADGRIKPDITAPGTVITGSRAGSGTSVSGQVDANVSWSTGTSHAAPQVAGAAALFTQFWKNAFGGSNPRPALIKAAVINSGQEMNGATTNLATIPNGNEGWGRINMKMMLNPSVPVKYVNQETVLSSPGTAVGLIGQVADPSKPVRVTLVWTDPPATGDPALVNNLDLQVNVNGTFYRGNVFSGGVSTPGGSGDTKDNVENVFLPAGVPAGSFFSVSVSAVSLNGDGVIGNADLTDQHYAIVAYNFQSLAVPTGSTRIDFDADHKTDISIFRPSSGQWWYNRSSNDQTVGLQFGLSSDVVAADDYTGDGKTDVGVYRPSNGQLFYLRSDDDSIEFLTPGGPGDIYVTGDFDGDGRADPSVYHPPTGDWYIARSSGGYETVHFGLPADLPAPADYDGDGKTDVAIFRPSTGQWWINRSTAGVIVYQFGASTDKIVQGDYTGDGKADVAIYRPSTGVWYVLRSEDASYFAVPFGTSGDIPVPGDYDGDGKFDRAVFRPSGATWYVDRSTAGFSVRNFGVSTDTPVPSSFVR